MVDILNKPFGIFIFLVCNQQWHICELYKLQNYDEYPALLPATDKPKHAYPKVDYYAKGDHSGRRKREENATHADDVPDTSPEDPCIPNPCKNSGICLVDREDSNDFNCVCKLDHRGKLCNDTLPSCAVECQEKQECVLSPDGDVCICVDGFFSELCKLCFCTIAAMPSCAANCQETQDCVLSLDGTVCICVGGFSSKLCKLEHVGLKILDNLVYTLSNQSTMQVEVFLGGLAFFMLIIFLCLTIHCCRVRKKRQKLRDEYKQLIRDGTVPKVLPPDWFDVSNGICKQVCCCKKAKPDVEKNSSGTSVYKQKRSLEDLELREEEFDRLMSQTSSLNVIRNRAPPRLKRHPSSSRSHVPSSHYDVTNLNSHASTTSDRSGNLSETYREERDDIDIFRKGVLNKDTYISDGPYYCVEKDGVSMIFNDYDYLPPVDKRKQRRKSHRVVASGNTHLGFDDDIDLPCEPTKGKRSYKHELYNEAYDEDVGMVTDEDIPLLKRKGVKRRHKHFSQSKRETPLKQTPSKKGSKNKIHDSYSRFSLSHSTVKHPVKCRSSSDDTQFSRHTMAGERQKYNMLSKNNNQQAAEKEYETVTREDMGKEVQEKNPIPTHHRGEKRHNYKAFSYSEVPHFLEISCNEANNNSANNNTGLLQQQSQSRKNNGINIRKYTRTRRQHRFSDISNDQNQSNSLLKSVPSEYYQNNCQKYLLNRGRTRSLEPIASHYDNTEYSQRIENSQRIDSAHSSKNSNTNAYSNTCLTECSVYVDTVNDEPQLCKNRSQHYKDTAGFSDEVITVEMFPPRQGTNNEITNLIKREATDAFCRSIQPSDYASSLIKQENGNSFVSLHGCFPEQPCENTTLLQNDSVSEKRAMLSTNIPSNVLVKEDSVESIDEATDTPFHIETSLTDVADICKKWLQQAEVTVANLTSKYPLTGITMDSADGEHEKVESDPSTTSLLSLTDGTGCSEDEECTIVASESNTSNCSEITVTAKTDDNTY